MDRRILRADILLFLTAGIWGFAFVAQRSGMEHVGPFAYTAMRFILGSLSLLPLILAGRRVLPRSGAATGKAVPGLKKICFFSVVAGCCLFAGITLQQLGIMFTTTGNAGFITGLYVVLTPVFGIFLKHKTGQATWIGAAFTLAGLYLVATNGGLESLNPGDILITASAFFWAFHVLIIDRFLVKGVDPVVLSFGQFAVCAVLALPAAIIAEPAIQPFVAGIDSGLLQTGAFGWMPLPALLSGYFSGTLGFPSGAVIPVLYGGICSVGIAYTLQVVAQKDAPPAHAAIILCFEGSFAALGGFLLLGEQIGGRTLAGFAFMLAGMLVSQLGTVKVPSGGKRFRLPRRKRRGG